MSAQIALAGVELVVIAAAVSVVVVLRRRRSAAPAPPPPPPPVNTVSSLATLAAQIERLHALNEAGLLSDQELEQAETALLEALPEI